jgi:F0F1-type ATP synthase assembly protein I
VWIVKAEDQPRAREILRDIGIAPATRFADELAQAREPRAPARTHMSMAAKLRIALIGAILVLILLRYLGIY